MSDGIEWADWIERIEVYRDGPEGQFCCNVWADDDAYWTIGEVFIGWADTVTEAIRLALTAGLAKEQEAKAAGAIVEQPTPITPYARYVEEGPSIQPPLGFWQQAWRKVRGE